MLACQLCWPASRAGLPAVLAFWLAKHFFVSSASSSRVHKKKPQTASPRHWRSISYRMQREILSAIIFGCFLLDGVVALCACGHSSISSSCRQRTPGGPALTQTELDLRQLLQVGLEVQTARVEVSHVISGTFRTNRTF